MEIENLFADIIKTSDNRKKSRYVERITYKKKLFSEVKKLELDGTTYDGIAGFKKRIFTEYILESYCGLEPTMREKVFFYDIYKTIADSINAKKKLIISCKSGKRILDLDFIPCLLENDEGSYSYYVAGYSRPCNSSGDYKMYSVRLKFITECVAINESPDPPLSRKQIYDLEETAAKNGIAYLRSQNSQPIIIRLNETGRKMFFSRVLRQRPMPVETEEGIMRTVKGEETFYYLSFDCSELQIRNYFFSFGKNACVISPKDLRLEFEKDYREALEQYSNIHEHPEEEEQEEKFD